MFITTNVCEKKKLFSNEAYARVAIETLYKTQAVHPFFLYAFVIMPDHCHLLVQVPEPESVSRIMNVWKGCTSNDIGIGPFWQKRFFVRFPDDAWATCRYIHLNPVKAGLVEQPEDYPWSSASGKWDVTELGQWE